MRQLSSATLLRAGGLALGLLSAAPVAAVPAVEIRPTTQIVTPGQLLSATVQISGLDSESPRQYVRSYDLLLGYDSTILSPRSVSLGQYAQFGLLLGEPTAIGTDGNNNDVPQVENDSPQYDLSQLTFKSGNPPHPADFAVELFQLSNLCLNQEEGSGQCQAFGTGPYLSGGGLQGGVTGFVLATISFIVNPLATPGSSTYLTVIDDTMIAWDPPAGIFDMKGNDRENPMVITRQGGRIDIAETPIPSTLTLLLSGSLVGLGHRVRHRWPTRNSQFRGPQFRGQLT